MPNCIFCSEIIGPRRSARPGIESSFCSKKCQAKIENLINQEIPAPFGWKPTNPIPFGQDKYSWLGWITAEAISAAKKYVRQRKSRNEDFWQQTEDKLNDIAEILTPEQSEKALLLRDLGLLIDATLEEAEKAYREMAKSRHPDAVGGSHDAMTELNLKISRLREIF